MFCRKTDILLEPTDMLIIGYGNAMRADDGAGPVVIEKLSALLPESCEKSVRLISCDQLTPELTLDIAVATRVIFVDASMALSPGQLTISPAQREEYNMLLGHQFTPGTLLAMTQRAFGASPSAWVAAIGCQCTDLSEQLSGRVSATVDRLVSHLYHGIRLWIDGHNFSPEVFPEVVPAATV